MRPERKIHEMTEIERIRVETTQDFLNQIRPRKQDSKNVIWRGLGLDSYDLVPRSLRPNEKECIYKLGNRNTLSPNIDSTHLDETRNQISCEIQILKNFYNYADNKGMQVSEKVELFNSETHFDADIICFADKDDYGSFPPKEVIPTMALAQHYGIPTRLLDWSKNRYSATYFAASSALSQMVELLKKPEHSIKEILERRFIVWSLNMNIQCGEKKIPKLDIVKRRYAGNPNMQAQQGCFTLWRPGKFTERTNRSSLEELVAEENSSALENFCSYSAPYKIVAPLLQELSCLGISANTLFHGFEGIIKNMNEEAEIFTLENRLR